MTERRERWFAVRLLSERRFPLDLAAEPLFEDTLLVLRAIDKLEAQKRGETQGLASQHEFENESGELVRWELREVLDVQELPDDDISDGSEVYSRFLGTRELSDIRRVLAARDGEPSKV